MFAGGAAPRTAGCCAPWGATAWACGAPPPRTPPRASPRAPRAPAPRAGGGPSGTTTALVMVASANVRLARLSHGVAATAARSRNALAIMVAPSSKSVGKIALKGRHGSTQVELDPFGSARAEACRLRRKRRRAEVAEKHPFGKEFGVFGVLGRFPRVAPSEPA